MFRKGTTLVRKLVPDVNGRLKPQVVALMDDIIGDRFWKENPEVIGLKSLATFQPSGLPLTQAPHPGHVVQRQANNKSPAVSARPNSLNAGSEDGNGERNPELEKHKMQCDSQAESRCKQ